MQIVRQAVSPTKAAAQLQSLIQHRYELSHASTQYRNKLTAICDELFPELVQVFRDPNEAFGAGLPRNISHPFGSCHSQSLPSA